MARVVLSGLPRASLTGGSACLQFDAARPDATRPEILLLQLSLLCVFNLSAAGCPVAEENTQPFFIYVGGQNAGNRELRRFTSDGKLSNSWSFFFNGGSGSASGAVFSIALDSVGNTYACGAPHNGSNEDSIIKKIGPDGTEIAVGRMGTPSGITNDRGWYAVGFHSGGVQQ